MPRRTQGSVYRTATGYGIRWPEDGRRPHRAGFKTKTEARRWFAENVAPRLDRGAPSSDVSFEHFCNIYLDRWGPTVADSTRRTLIEWLAPAREQFGDLDASRARGRRRRHRPLAGRIRRTKAPSADAGASPGARSSEALGLYLAEPCGGGRT